MQLEIVDKILPAKAAARLMPPEATRLRQSKEADVPRQLSTSQ
jgi:hypothetical protein